MSNFFAALDDSDNEGKAPVPAPAKKKSAPKKPEVVEPSKVDKRAPKGDRNTKGGRSERPPARDGKRTHDRRSGTGRGKEIKKGGGGGRNWGSDQNDAKKAEGPVTEGKEAVNTPEAEAEATVEKTEGEKKAVEEKEPEPEEEEDNTMSYEEYLAQKARPDSVAFKPVSEREIDNEFAGKAAAAKKKEVESDFLVMAGGKQPKKKGKGKKEKETLILDFKVKSAISTDERREGGRREGGGGGRGGDRRREGGGGRGGGGDRGGQREQRTRTSGGGGGGGGKKGLDTTDASAFPSL